MTERVYIASPEVSSYLQELAKLGIYGTRPGAVATWICRKEIMRLVELGVLKPIQFVERTTSAGSDDEGE
jgi:hypothetical protein